MNSQFEVYTSSDAGAPQITGQSGSLLAMLNWCLITGSGWLKPLADNNNCGCFQQPSGSGLTYYVNDSANNIQSARIAVVTGYENITGLTAATTGTGTGMFPLNSNYFVRKSATTDTVTRYWRCYADAYTCYYFIWNGDNSPSFTSNYCFGDIFSLYTQADKYKCFINGRVDPGVDSIANGTVDPTKMIQQGSTTYNLGTMARNFGGTGISMQVNRWADLKIALSSTNGLYYGSTPAPNPTDQSYYLSPIWVVDASNIMRGRCRGLWAAAHPSINFSDGQILQGANEFYGKKFAVAGFGYGGSSNPFWLVEISNTVETNSL